MGETVGASNNDPGIVSPTDTITNIHDDTELGAPNLRHTNSKSSLGSATPTTKRRGCTAARVKSCLRTFLVHLFSHVGLCIIVVGYAICGGFLFNELESKPQMDRVGSSFENYQRTINESRMAYVRHLWKITEKFNVLYEKEWNQAVEAELTQFSEIISNTTEQKRISEEEITWTFSRALLYSVSIITTIGYGDLAPKTEAGRILTMFYAVLGVPLMLLWVSNIGTVMANTFKFIYVHARCCSPVTPSKKKTSKPVQPSGAGNEKTGTGGVNTVVVINNTKHKRKGSKNSSLNSESSVHTTVANNVGAGNNGNRVRTNSILSRKNSSSDTKQQQQANAILPPVSSSQVEYSISDRKYETRLVEGGNQTATQQQQQSSFCCPQSSSSLSSSPLLSVKDLHSGAKQILLECAQYNLNNCCPGRNGQDDENSRRILQQLYYNNAGSLVQEDGMRRRGGDDMSEDPDSSGIESVIEIKVAPPPPPTEVSSDSCNYYSSTSSAYLMPDHMETMSAQPPLFPPPCCTNLYNTDPAFCQPTPPPPPPPFGYGTVVVVTTSSGGTASDTTSSTLRNSSFGSSSVGSGTNSGNKKYLTMSGGVSVGRSRGNSFKRKQSSAPQAEVECDDDDSLTIMQGTPSRVPLLLNEKGSGGNGRGQPDVVDIDNFCCSDYDELASSPGKNQFIVTQHSIKHKKASLKKRASKPSIDKPGAGGTSGGSTEPDIPISLVLFVVLTYILAGAGAFTILEDWGFIEGAYFCFITLSTIGLGDILPGKTVDSVSGSTAGAAKLVFCCLYLVLGLAIIAMSFNLVQEKVSTGVKNFGRRMGVLKDEVEVEDEER